MGIQAASETRQKPPEAQDHWRGPLIFYCFPFLERPIARRRRELARRLPAINGVGLSNGPQSRTAPHKQSLTVTQRGFAVN